MSWWITPIPVVPVPGGGTDASASEGTFTDDITENKNLLFQLLFIKALLKLAQMPGGMETIRVLGKELIKGLFDSLDSLGQASAANAVAAWANPVLISAVFGRFGLVPPRFNAGFHKGITVISGVDVATDVLTDLFGAKGAFPSTLTFAKRNYTTE